MNQLLSHWCLMSLCGSFVIRIPHAIVFYLGPMPSNYCSFSMSCSRYLFLLTIAELLTRQTTKFLYIFKWKYIVGLNEDFAAVFLTLNNSVLSAVFIYTTHFLGYFTAEVDYHVCMGRNPSESIAKAFEYLSWNTEERYEKFQTINDVGKKDPMGLLILPLLLIGCVQAFIIWLYGNQRRLKRLCFIAPNTGVAEGQDSTQAAVKNSRFEETKCLIISNGGVLLFTLVGILLLSPMARVKELMKVNPEDLNHGPGKVSYYAFRITMPLLAFYLLPLVTLIGNSEMRRTLMREFRDQVLNR